MELLLKNDVWTLNLGMIATLALAILLLFLGKLLRKKIYFLERFCIPAPVISGLVFSFLTLFFHETNTFSIKMDTLFQVPFMLLFFTCIGLSASLKFVKKGGKPLLIYWVACIILVIMQNTIGAFLAGFLKINPLLGIMMGAVSMEGGHGTAAAFGPVAESLGAAGATTVGIAAATFGLVSGGLIGSPLAKHLIERYKLKPSGEDIKAHQEAAQENASSAADTDTIMAHLAAITICMTLGLCFADYLKSAFNFIIPNYVGAMFTAVIFRNLNDRLHFLKLHALTIDTLGNIGLGIFLSMALMTLKLWQLSELAIPMLVILFTQVLFIALYCRFAVFYLLGKNYDAAVIVAGLAGHGLGATPNAMANMTSIVERYGPSGKAFLVVPLCGAFLVDLFGIPCIVWFLNAFA